MLNKKNPLWLSDFDPTEMNEYLLKLSLSIIEDIGNKEFMERYIKPGGRDLTVMDIERTVLSEVK